MRVNKAKIQRSFANASLTYDGVATLQRTVGEALLLLLDANKITGTVLDLGCGTGFLTGELIKQSSYKTLLALDIALPMLQATQDKLTNETNINYICADAEHLPFAAQSIDSVFSNLALQWCSHLECVFTDIKRTLKPEGQLVFSTFGSQTLQELKKAWSTVDSYHHVNAFYNQAQINQHLKQAGFTNIKIKSTVFTSRYDSVWTLMKELKHLGAQHVIVGRNNKTTTKTAMQKMIAAYEKHKVSDQIPATFEVISVIAKV
ncbi:MAG: malonyl-ACP O-methyltransferase BioC [Methylococcales bacterium]|jgi:malonyl-CoA O-methyltransferase|nr:malonyl-ACP O-methyltransferase BioC [Methylococcales bacterium]